MSNNRCYIILRSDLNMPEGKMAVQVGHAIDAIWSNFVTKSSTDKNSVQLPEFQDWIQNNRRKVVLKIDNEVKLENLKTKLQSEGYHAFDIEDYGMNFFDGLTRTGIVVYPVNHEIKSLKRVRCW